MEQLPFDNYLLVAAIDFGTTYSGYAFSMRDEFKKDPLKIHCNQVWNAGGRQLLSLKTSTCLLLDSQKKFVSFGYDAENRFSELVMEEQHTDYLYFHRFKMNLHNTQKLNKDLVIKDLAGKSCLAIEVFALSIQALKDHLLEALKTQGINVDMNDIQWVITVPAIWSDSAKQFMRKSAGMAGIDGEKLRIALEPEAASIYCQHLPLEKCKEGFTITEVGTKYLVADLGGGTADLTVHEKLNGVKLKEICRVSGGDCGGTNIDTAFINMLESITSKAVIKALKHKNPEEYLDLCREFETKKRTIVPGKTGMITMAIPFTTINHLCQKHEKKDFGVLIESSALSSKVSLHRDKIRVDAEYFITLFTPTITEIINLITDQLKNRNAKDVNTLLLVGGFSCCQLVQDGIKKAFSGRHVVVPADSELSVLKGAVIYGHMPGIITERVAKMTYGYGGKKPFDSKKHDRKYLVIEDGVEMCNHLFREILKKNSVIPVGSAFTYNVKTFTNDAKLSIYASDEESPKYTTEKGCYSLGRIKLNYSKFEGEKVKQIIKILFGDTEISVTVEEKDTGKIAKANFEMI